jgi:hypothetical protein
MEATMADEQFAARAAQLAVSDIEQHLIQSTRDYQDAQRDSDELTAADALKRYADYKQQYDILTGAAERQQQSQQQSGQLSNAQRNFLSRRAAGGDELSATRMKDYALAHTRCVNSGIPVDSPQYFQAIAHYADTMGDGRQKPLDEREAAKIAGVDERTYAANAERLRALKRAGNYQE